jgi:hypothetical protein
MANALNIDRQITIIGALARRFRSIERITGVHSDTVMRLAVRVARVAAGIERDFWRVGQLLEAHGVYAWSNDTDDPANPEGHVTVLHLHPVKSARDAARAFIVKESRIG